MDQIIPHLYISNWNYSNTPEQIQKNKIKAVITLETRPKPDYILQYYKKNNIDFMYININDMPNDNICQYLDFSYNFIQKYISKGENVLVHCWAGISRSATIVLNYIYRDNMTQYSKGDCVYCRVKNIIKYMRTKRSIINPNPGFIEQIIKNYKENSKYSTSFSS
jgi:dual specificity phosphatase 12